MANVILTDNQINEYLNEQIEFLKVSCRSYDSGFIGESKRLATTLRTLVHDTPKSNSLLKLANKTGMNFIDTAIPYDDGNLLSHSSLVQFHMTLSGTKIMPFLDDTEITLVPFLDWWNGIVLVDSKRNEFSRKDITLYLANKAGGAHVDRAIDELYDNLCNKNSMGWNNGLGDGRVIAGEDNVPATMRQIAHEAIKSFDKTYSCNVALTSDTKIVIKGMGAISGAQIDLERYPNLKKNRPQIDGRRVGRNDLCPCGSGKKYKKCCI